MVWAYWPFNGNAIDESEYEHDGVVYGAELTDDRLGNPESPIILTDTAILRYPNTRNMNLEHGYTMAAWTNPEYYTLHSNVISRVPPKGFRPATE